jgi:hypothetical protein
MRRPVNSLGGQQGIKNGCGQIIGSEVAPFSMAVQKNNGGSAAMAGIIKSNHARARVWPAALVKGCLGEVPNVPIAKLFGPKPPLGVDLCDILD